jgi:hypothetical protein
MDSNFPTLKAARAAGYRSLRRGEYGGEQTVVKGRTLVRNPEMAVSETEWGRRGFAVKPDAQPHAYLSGYSYYHSTWPVYREDQVEPKKERNRTPPKRIDVLVALWVVNRAAKRYRDAASKHYGNARAAKHSFDRERAGALFGLANISATKKRCYYRLKSQATAYLVAEGHLTVVGYHRFGNNWAEVLQADVYTVHRPCPPQPGDAGARQIDDIEAKPRGAKEPRLKYAIHTLKKYLKGKPVVPVYEWPARPKPGRRRYVEEVADDYDDLDMGEQDELDDGWW